MGLPQTTSLLSLDDYLDFERREAVRHEYFDGLVYAMAGESLERSMLCFNLAAILGSQLMGTPCRGLSPNMKVLSGDYSPGQMRGLFSYPDVTVVCGEPKFHDERRDVLLNPTLIVEMLSPGTESFDRGEKFQRYRKHLDSLQDFVLVSSAYPLIQLFQRQPNGFWLYSAAAEIDASMVLPSIGCEVPLAQLYDRQIAPAAESEQE
ncbi:Uma2 family endonuclease [uncultured Thiodictyon sp.]|uniref:Uma2 family endonuclease n=1 Tax=uncultured Thiodictyon sp. TaxID=1846217 RepID=UPI0025D3CA50|nr:Uma2 family endonuclease [uncultured Thiodictyon sp.]